ncbi:MAG: hypothetical protein JKP98_16110 [Rhodobacteraceae bacterium]|nr:hypothetical protein [Paracoccaceae bacterium]
MSRTSTRGSPSARRPAVRDFGLQLRSLGLGYLRRAQRGAALVLPREADRLSPEAWAAQAGGAGVTAWNSVPAVAGMLLDAGLPPTLRLVLMSGDKVPMDLALALDAVEG